MPNVRVRLTALFILVAMAGCAPQNAVRERMPYPGELEPGQIVFVDDGRCPAGEVTQVTGGSKRFYDTETRKAGAPRDIRCVPR